MFLEIDFDDETIDTLDEVARDADSSREDVIKRAVDLYLRWMGDVGLLEKHYEQ